MSDATIIATVRYDIACLNLRADSGNSEIRDAIEGVLGQPLPAKANTTSTGNSVVYWLGPDEWLVTMQDAGREDLIEQLEQGAAGMHVAINDVSGGNVFLEVAGEHSRDLFAKGCTLDFHPDVFKVGDCAQSGLAKASVLFGLADNAPTFNVVVRRSFSDYLMKWLRHAGREYGIVFNRF